MVIFLIVDDKFNLVPVMPVAQQIRLLDSVVIVYYYVSCPGVVVF